MKLILALILLSTSPLALAFSNYEQQQAMDRIQEQQREGQQRIQQWNLEDQQNRQQQQIQQLQQQQYQQQRGNGRNPYFRLRD